MGTENTFPAPHPPKLLDQVRDKIRVKHYSIRTETQYLQWVKRFISTRPALFKRLQK